MLWYALAPLAVLLVVALALPYEVLRESRRAAVRLDGTHSERRADAERAARRRYVFTGAVVPVLLAMALAAAGALVSVPPPPEEAPALLDLDNAEGAQQGRAAERARFEQMLAMSQAFEEQGLAGSSPSGTVSTGSLPTPTPASPSGTSAPTAAPGPAAGEREAEAFLGRPLTGEERARLAELRQRYAAGESPAELMREGGLETALVREAAGTAVQEWLGTTAQRYGVPALVAVATLLLALFVVLQKKRFVGALRERRRRYYATDNRRLEAAG